MPFQCQAAPCEEPGDDLGLVPLPGFLLKRRRLLPLLRRLPHTGVSARNVSVTLGSGADIRTPETFTDSI